MYALLALCHVLAPTRLDDNVMNIVRERYGEQIGRMGRGYASHTIIQSTVTECSSTQLARKGCRRLKSFSCMLVPNSYLPTPRRMTTLPRLLRCSSHPHPPPHPRKALIRSSMIQLSDISVPCRRISCHLHPCRALRVS